MGGSFWQLDVIAGQGGTADTIDSCLDGAILDGGCREREESTESIKTDSWVAL